MAKWCKSSVWDCSGKELEEEKCYCSEKKARLVKGKKYHMVSVSYSAHSKL